MTTSAVPHREAEICALFAALAGRPIESGVAHDGTAIVEGLGFRATFPGKHNWLTSSEIGHYAEHVRRPIVAFIGCATAKVDFLLIIEKIGI